MDPRATSGVNVFVKQNDLFLPHYKGMENPNAYVRQMTSVLKSYFCISKNASVGVLLQLLEVAPKRD